ncbi:hypothetical protein ABES02_01880 [Neobacillus pocheonensis]|uniref:hypothetical protein n=1 Tax=Neobacillus pocheonensis TaxID=363869 RepID=UPI003D28C7BE
MGADFAITLATLMERQIYSKGGKEMAKNKNNQFNKKNNALPKADAEFAEERGNGLEKVALRAQKSQNK